ncbi:general transcription factor IIH subunit 1-like [Oscarella lobularis]|uniref:general transcription factor IIH subunit 1-like n=1 Tax=Oscarella lobularis TaxID=121494 RepID=UPI003313BBE9
MASVEWDDGEELISELPSVRHAKKDGVLYLTNRRIAWMEYSAPTFKISHSYSQLKSQKISPEASSKVQLQIVLHEGASATFHFAKASREAALQERNMVKDMLVRLIQQHKPKPNKELEEKTRILNNNPALFQLYKDLVVSGMLSAEEFWANQNLKKDSDGSQGSEQESQPIGISSATLAELEPQVDGANAVKYTLTPDSIQAIFRTYPAVAKIHKENVPDKMSEKQFWEQFFVSYYFHHERSGGGKASSKKKDVISQSALQDEKDLLDQCVDRIRNPLVNLATESSESELAEGYGAGLHTKKALEASALPSGPIPIIRKFNHQSMMILKARSSDKDREEEESQAKKARLLRESVEYTELERQLESNELSLRIANVKHYSEGPAGPKEAEMTSDDDSKYVQAFAEEIQNWKPKFEQVLSSELACRALADLSPGGVLSEQSTSSQYMSSSDLQEELLRQHNALAELLRHFWLCFPVTTAFLEEKVVRMVRCLQNYRETKLQEFKQFLAADEQQLAAPLELMVQSAVDKYTAWAARKAKGKRKL